MKLLLALAAGLAGISTEDLRKEFPVDSVDTAIVSDAIARLSEKERSTEDVAMKDVVPIVVRFPNKRCVVMWIRQPYLGSGSSIYCYDDSDKLIEAYEDYNQ